MKKLISILAIVALIFSSCKKNSPEPIAPTPTFHQAEVFITSSGSKNFYINGNEMIGYVFPTTYTVKTGDVLKFKADAYHGNAYNFDYVGVIMNIDGTQVIQQLQYSNIEIIYVIN